MDAKPQRFRAMRIFDENTVAPPAALGKTLHSRTKSVPLLSAVNSGAARTTAAAAAVAALHKKVLGEVNTNLKVLPPVNDDSIIGKKAVTVDFVKPSAPLARPASRPSTAKSFSTFPSSNGIASKEPVSLPAVPLQEPARKLVAKKSTKVLQDSEIVNAPVTTGQAAVTLSAHANELSVEAAPVSAPVQSVVVESAPSQDLPLHENVEFVNLRTQTTTTSSQTSLLTGFVPGNFNAEEAYLKDLEGEKGLLAQRSSQVQAEHSVESNRHIDVQSQQQGASVLPCAMPATVSAQHYYDEEDLSYYDDGYTTTRSFGLRGGLRGESIGGSTTVLAPKQTDKTRAEIDAAKAMIDGGRGVDEADEEEWDTSMVAEYSEEIFEYMRKLENRMIPNPRYMDQQTEIQWSMRAVLVDWVVQVHQRFNLLPETLFLAVNYIDRFLTCKIVSLGKLQLVGATAIFIAAKFEEVNCPTLQEIIFMVDGGYTVDELLKAERFMLSMLQFDLGWPGPMSFLRRISKADDYDLETRTLAKYFLEVTMMDERFVGCTPSFLAAGSHCMARLMLRKGDWTSAHVAFSEYTYAQLRPLLNGIFECCEDAQKHHVSVYEKYTDKRYKRASVFVEAEMLKGFSLYTLAPRSSLGNAIGIPLMR